MFAFPLPVASSVWGTAHLDAVLLAAVLMILIYTYISDPLPSRRSAAVVLLLPLSVLVLLQLSLRVLRILGI